MYIYIQYTCKLQKAEIKSAKGVLRIQNILGMFDEALLNPLFREQFQMDSTTIRQKQSKLSSSSTVSYNFSKEEKKIEKSIQKIIAVYGLVNWILEKPYRRVLSESEATAIVRKLIDMGHLHKYVLSKTCICIARVGVLVTRVS